MLEHLNPTATKPERVVILGAGGFVGGAARRLLEQRNIPVLPLARIDVELTCGDAANKIAGTLRETDALVVISAKAPCKDHDMLLENIAMMTAVCHGIEKTKPAHLIYISSDAVYRDSTEPLKETSCAEPGSLHGVMHLARELMLKAVYDGPLCVLRPTLLYGAADPHNGYGPNSFRRKATGGQDIVLFGEGEERRDHVLIGDVAELIFRCLMHRSKGTLNIATGEVVSFRDIAEMVVSHFETPVAITGSPRSGPMPHDGYRPFDASASAMAFPDFSYTRVAAGIELVHREALEEG